MLFGGEKKLRQATNEDWSVIIKEIQNKGKTYCRIHTNFKDGNTIYEPFEVLCDRYKCKE